MNLKSIGLGVALLLSVSCRAAEPNEDTWMSGFWHMTADEDNGPLGGVMEFRPDGTFIGYDKGCNPLGDLSYHVFKGDIYVASEVPGKGPVSVLFHPNADRTKLTFTSPRTRNNAVYERVLDNKCVVQS